MKTTKTIGAIVLMLIFNACEFNQSVNKNLVTGAFTRGDGITCDEVLIEIDDKKVNRNTFSYGEKVNFIFNDVSGLNKEDGRGFPALTLYIVKNEIDTVLSQSNLLDGLKNGTKASPLQLQASFIASLPFANEEEYELYIKIWDRKGAGSYVYQLPFNVEESKILQINSKGLSYSNIYLWDDTEIQVITGKDVNIENTLILILEGLDGMDVVNNKVYPSFSIEITDSEAKQLISNPDILSKYNKNGIDYKVFKGQQLPVSITFTRGRIVNPCRLTAILKDNKSNKKIEIEAELIIE